MRKPPNILYIMADDHAANAVSCYGSELAGVFRTPHLDRIAAEGLRMNNFFSTNSICTPARATIMTGQYGHINGVRTLLDAWNPDCSENIALRFRDSGYATALIGKWHLHCEPLGFEHWDILPGQGVYCDPIFINHEMDFVRDIADYSRPLHGKKHSGYVTDIITGKSIDYLRQRDRTKPFFMMVHHKAPHDYWQYAERHEHMFDNVEIPVPESLFEDKQHRSEASRSFGSTVSPKNKVRSLYREFIKPDYCTGPLTGTENMSFKGKALAACQKYLRDYLRTVAAIDEGVGLLMHELETQGDLDNTLIIYTSDQGMFLGEHDYQDKRWSYEESLRAPFLVRFPPEIAAGSVSDQLMANIDIAPTLLDYANIDIPDSMQGRSLRKCLSDPCEKGRDAVYFRYWMHLAHRHQNPAHFGIRSTEWKLICYYGLPLDANGAVQVETPGGWELYNLKSDPYEMHNLHDKAEYTPVIKKLKKRLFELRKQYQDTDDQYPQLLEKITEMS